MSQQDRLDELNVVELPLIAQLGAMGWTHIDGADEDPNTGRKTSTFSAARTFNRRCCGNGLPRYPPAQPQPRRQRMARYAPYRPGDLALERPVARDFIAINEELHEKIVSGVYVSGPPGEHERLVGFISFETSDLNDFRAINQFRVDPPGAIGDKGFIVPDIVLFVNGIPLVVIEAKSPVVTDPLATAIDQLRRYANRRVPEKNEGAEQFCLDEAHLLIPTDYYDARVGSVSARPDDFLPWRDVKPATRDWIRFVRRTRQRAWRRTCQTGDPGGGPAPARRSCSTPCDPSPFSRRRSTGSGSRSCHATSSSARCMPLWNGCARARPDSRTACLTGVAGSFGTRRARGRA